jgi:hypothetical protein
VRIGDGDARRHADLATAGKFGGFVCTKVSLLPCLRLAIQPPAGLTADEVGERSFQTIEEFFWKNMTREDR